MSQDPSSVKAPKPRADTPSVPSNTSEPRPKRSPIVQPPGEVGGPKGPEPTRYGDWERGGRVSDF
ncbi:MAG: DUF1674 domain-containing protein [Alphaproteobacteria bacterium]|nr:DUF1674 domain-containing protein [Alphaproteobacteria bacterium]